MSTNFQDHGAPYRPPAADHSERHRIEGFRDEIAELELKTPEDRSERSLVLVGVALMVVGAVVILLGYVGASGTAFVNEQLPYLLSGGLFGLGLMVAGAAVFVRYSISRYLRFWLIREIYEQRAQTDRMVDSVDEVSNLLRRSMGPR